MPRKGGFTLVELLVVIGITVFLSSILILYGRSSRQQVALYVEEAQISQEILRAKSLSISTYHTNGSTCGYGVHIDYSRNTFSLFSYLPNPPQNACDNITSLVPSGSESDIETFYLNSNLSFGTATERLDYVFFLPPNPNTLLAVNGSPTAETGSSADIPLNTKDGSASVTITVSPAGQVTF